MVDVGVDAAVRDEAEEVDASGLGLGVGAGRDDGGVVLHQVLLHLHRDPEDVLATKHCSINPRGNGTSFYQVCPINAIQRSEMQAVCRLYRLSCTAQPGMKQCAEEATSRPTNTCE